MRRALCVGIDLYSFNALHGCVSDADRLADSLRRNEDGSPNFDIRRLTAPIGGKPDVVTRSALRASLDELLKHSADVALLVFPDTEAKTTLVAIS